MQVGKRHLGTPTEFLPTPRGFDEWLGLPYSNDQWPLHPEKPGKFPPLPLYEGDKVINPGLSHVVRRTAKLPHLGSVPEFVVVASVHFFRSARNGRSGKPAPFSIEMIGFSAQA